MTVKRPSRLEAEKRRFKNVRIIATELQSTPAVSNIRTRRRKPRYKPHPQITVAPDIKRSSFASAQHCMRRSPQENEVYDNPSMPRNRDSQATLDFSSPIGITVPLVQSSWSTNQASNMQPPSQLGNPKTPQMQGYLLASDPHQGASNRHFNDPASMSRDRTLVAKNDVPVRETVVENAKDGRDALALTVEQAQQMPITWEHDPLDSSVAQPIWPSSLLNRTSSTSLSPSTSFRSISSQPNSFIPRNLPSPILRTPSAWSLGSIVLDYQQRDVSVWSAPPLREELPIDNISSIQRASRLILEAYDIINGRGACALCSTFHSDKFYDEMALHLQDYHKVPRMWIVVDISPSRKTFKDCEICMAETFYKTQEEAEVHLMSHIGLLRNFLPKEVAQNALACNDPTSYIKSSTPAVTRCRKGLSFWMADIYTQYDENGLPVPLIKRTLSSELHWASFLEEKRVQNLLKKDADHLRAISPHQDHESQKRRRKRSSRSPMKSIRSSAALSTPETIWKAL